MRLLETSIHVRLARRLRIVARASARALFEDVEQRRLLAAVSGSVFTDANSNGRRDTGEAGLANQVVYADYNYDGKLSAGEPSATTTSGGTYTLTTDLKPFALRMQLTTGQTQTAPAGNGPYYYEVKNGALVGYGSEFGVTSTTPPPPPVYDVAGFVFNDANGNGKQDAGETGLAGVTIYADLNYNASLDTGEPSVISDANGFYYLTTGAHPFALRAIAPTGGSVTSPANNQPYYYEVSGNTVNGYGGNRFGVKPATVTPPETGTILVHRAVIGQEALAPLDSGVPTSDEVYGGFFNNDYSFWVDTNHNDVRDANEPTLQTALNFEISLDVGSLVLHNLPLGTYRIDASPSSTVGATAIASQTVQLDGPYAETSFTLPAPTGIVWGHVYFDVNANGQNDHPADRESYGRISGGSVFADYNQNGQLDAGETSAQLYFVDVGTGPAQLNGLYVLRPQAGRTFALGATAVPGFIGSAYHLLRTSLTPRITIGADNPPTLYDIGFAPSRISGQVYVDTNGNGLHDAGEPTAGAGSTLFVDTDGDGVVGPYDVQTTTDANGNYTLNFYTDATATVYFTPPAGKTVSGRAAVTYQGRTDGMPIRAANVDFGIASATTTIATRVVLDANGNGIVDGNEISGVAGQTVFADYNYNGILDAGEDSAVTGASGLATLAVQNKPFQLALKPASGFTQSAPGAHGVFYYEPKNGVPTGYGNTFGVQATNTPPTTTAVSGYLYFDNNRNTVRDAGDTAFASTVVYADLNNNGHQDANEPYALSSAGTGAYTIVNVPVGTTFGVRYSGTLNRDLTSPNIALYANVDAGRRVTTMVGAAPRTDVNFGFAPTGGTQIQAFVYDDADHNGRPNNSGQTYVTPSLAWVDTDRDGVYDANEPLLYSLASNGPPLAITLITNQRNDTAEIAYALTGTVPGTIAADEREVAFAPTDSNAVVAFALPFTTPLPGNVLIKGTVFTDSNADGVKDEYGFGVGGQEVWADYDYDGVVDSNEPIATTSSDGSYTLDVRPGPTALRLLHDTSAGAYQQTYPFSSGPRFLNVPSGSPTITGQNFGVSLPYDPAGNSYALVFFGDQNGNNTQDSFPTEDPFFYDFKPDAWLDLNGNGARDPSDATAVYDGSGDFRFDVAPGTYILHLGSGPGSAASAIYTRGNVQTVTLTADHRAIQVGVTNLGEIDLQLFNDVNGNGQDDNDEGQDFMHFDGRSFWIDADRDGVYDAGEQIGTINRGRIDIAVLPGDYSIQIFRAANEIYTVPPTLFTVRTANYTYEKIAIHST